MPSTRPVTVRGGSNGITAHITDLHRLGRTYAAAGATCGEHLLALHAYLLDPALLASSVLDPVGAIRFERALLAALDGSHGLTRIAAQCAATAVALRAAADLYVAADRLDTQVATAVSGVTGAGAGVGAFGHGLFHGGIGRAFVELAAADPFLADTAVDVLSDFWSESALISMVAALPDGRAEVRRIGADLAQPEQAAPHSVQDLMAGLAWRNRAPTGGDVDIRFVTSRDAHGRPLRRVIVDIPGTKSWRLASSDPDPTSLQTNLKAVTGARTTYQQGVLEAMRQAGVQRNEPVLLVGHSQGGMVAVNVAEEAARSREFAVTNIVTAGSPIARLAVPAHTQVLAIENDGDIVPHADGAQNPDTANLTTVTVHRNTGDAVVNHDVSASYVPAAADVDASTDASVRTSMQKLRPFLAGTRVSTVVFHISRR